MPADKRSILAIPGSLRANSANHAVVNAIAKMMPSNVEFKVYNGLGSLPHFDGNENPPAQVKEFRAMINAAHGVLICSPEYAFGVPGSLKNALDWTVSSGEFTGKPTALITAATGGDKAHAALLLILSAIDASVNDDAKMLISFVRSKIDAAGEVTDAATLQGLQKVVDAIVKF